MFSHYIYIYIFRITTIDLRNNKILRSIDFKSVFHDADAQMQATMNIQSAWFELVENSSVRNRSKYSWYKMFLDLECEIRMIEGSAGNTDGNGEIIETLYLISNWLISTRFVFSPFPIWITELESMIFCFTFVMRLWRTVDEQICVQASMTDHYYVFPKVCLHRNLSIPANQ